MKPKSDFRAGVVRLLLMLPLTVAALAAYQYREQVGMDGLWLTVADAGGWAPLLFVALFAIATVLLVPAVVFLVAGGALFGPGWGSLLNLTGATVGAAGAFLIARYAASSLVRRRAGARLQRLVRGVDSQGWRFVAIVRLLPGMPFFLLNYALGLTGIRFWVYVATTAAALVPSVVLLTYVGYAGREVLGGNEKLLLPAVGVALAAALLPGLIRRLRDIREREGAPQ